MKDTTKIYIDGAWVDSAGTGSIDVINAATEEVMGRVPAGTAADVDRAVEAARRAFDGWSQRTPEERRKELGRLHEGLQARAEEIAQTIAGEVGMPIKMARQIQVGLPLGNLASFVVAARGLRLGSRRSATAWSSASPSASWAASRRGTTRCTRSCARSAPALAAGCTVVLKPSEVAPLNAWLLAEVVDEVGLPAGVFNLVSGTGPEVGEAIAAHPGIDMVSFTGSTRAGKRVAEVAAATVKKVALELGGKSANVILDDADFAKVVPAACRRCYLNSGQTCTALTRMLVPQLALRRGGRAGRAPRPRTFKVGDPWSRATTSARSSATPSANRVQGYIAKGVDEGARSSPAAPSSRRASDAATSSSRRCSPTSSNDMTIAQEEIFGPVLCHPLRGRGRRRAHRQRHRLRPGRRRVVRRPGAGQARSPAGCAPARSTSTAARFNIRAPFGGYKQSGIGRELGPFGLEEFLTVKSLQL